MEDDLRTGTPYRISCLRQQPSGVDKRCQIWPIRGYTRFWYTVMSFLKLISQAFPRPLPQSPLVFFPLFRSLSFSLALYYLNAWTRLTRQSPWRLSRSIFRDITIALRLHFFAQSVALYGKNNRVLLSQALCVIDSLGNLMFKLHISPLTTVLG